MEKMRQCGFLAITASRVQQLQGILSLCLIGVAMLPSLVLRKMFRSGQNTHTLDSNAQMFSQILRHQGPMTLTE